MRDWAREVKGERKKGQRDEVMLPFHCLLQQAFPLLFSTQLKRMCVCIDSQAPTHVSYSSSVVPGLFDALISTARTTGRVTHVLYLAMALILALAWSTIGAQ